MLNYRVRHELDDEGWRPPDTSATLLVERRRTTFRGELVVHPRRDVRVRLRSDTRFVDFSGGRSNETGSLIFADLQWMPTRTLRATLRYTVYRAPSIHSAAYTLEVPITGMMQTVAGTGNGSRLVVSARWSATPWITAHVMAMRWVREGHPIQLRAAAQLDVSV